VTRFLLDTSTVAAVIWKLPDASVLEARLERAGKTAPFVDGQIAAVAVTCGLPLVTANPVDFKPFKGLTVVNWVSAKPG
jgi:predicted nucleic acid-binding protein